nr:hypothetical protein [Mucilaginibacter sp. X4EP1]
MYKNVSNQCIVALFLWFSSCYLFFLTKYQSIKGISRQLTLMLNGYLNKYRSLNQFSTAPSILNNPSI